MISYISSAILMSSMLFSFAAPAPEKTVTLKGAISSKANAETGHFTVTVEMDIKDGWHTYADPGEGPEVKTTLELKAPEGVKADGGWKSPDTIEGKELGSQYYVGKVSFSKDVVVQPSNYGKKIEVLVSHQACTSESCNRPLTKTVSITIPEAPATSKNAAASSSVFESPVRLTVDGKPLNGQAGLRFPSPGIFDVDGDGKAELVVGSLMGSVNVYKNLNKSENGDPVWGPRESFKDAEGKQIKTSNW